MINWRDVKRRLLASSSVRRECVALMRKVPSYDRPSEKAAKKAERPEDATREFDIARVIMKRRHRALSLLSKS